MGEVTGQIEHEIEVHRRELGRNISELEEKARSLTDWHEYYRKNPVPFLLTAAAGGWLLSAMLGGGSSSSYALARPRAVDLQEPRTMALTSRAGRKAADTWNHIADALLDLASDKVVEYVSGVVPGFHERYRGPFLDRASAR